MAAVADVQTVNISINDIPLQVPKGEMIVESVKRLGLEIPIFCYHPRMKPVGMCRMCLVECAFKMPDGSVRKMPKPQAGCTLPASEGLMVYTDTEAIHKDRKGVLEFLLINHPLDCPICDRGGECPLQNNTLAYGPSTSRFVELKRHAPKAFPLSQYVTLDLERCIQCGRCVRFTEEISGDSQLAFRFRGGRMQPSTFEMRDFDSKFSGNVIEICPVGALTSTKYRFRARPWDLQTRPATCTLCSNGCSVHMDYRADEIVRINGRTNEAVNEEWTCDRGKFGHYKFNSDKRLKLPHVRNTNSLSPVSWAEAYASILGGLDGLKGPEIAVIAGGTRTNEDLFTLKHLFHDTLKSANMDYRVSANLATPDSPFGVAATATKLPIASYESKKAILVFGTSLADEEPILFLRVRKAWFKYGAKVVVATDVPTDVDSFAQVILRYRPGTGDILAAGLASVAAGDASALSTVEAATGVRATDIASAAAILKENAAPIIATSSLIDQQGGAEALTQLNALAAISGSICSVYSTTANEQGAADLGFLPGKGGRNTYEILQGCVNGEIKFLWLAGVDLFAEYVDQKLVEAALENVEFLVVQDVLQSETVGYASVVLPATAPSEADGSYTNLERRVQRSKPVMSAPGESKPVWRAVAELSLRIKPEAPLFNAGEVMDRIAAKTPAFAKVAYATLEDGGQILE